MIFKPCYFYFFSILGEWGGWVLESMENSILFFFFEGFPIREFSPKNSCTQNVSCKISFGSINMLLVAQNIYIKLPKIKVNHSTDFYSVNKMSNIMQY